MADTAKSSSESVSNFASSSKKTNDKTPGGTSPTTDDGSATKTRSRPSKLKTPLDLVISTDVSASASHHRPIGTPPPTSLRKPRLGELHASFPPEQFDSFPKINVESLEGPEDDDVQQESEKSFGSSIDQFRDNHKPSLDKDDLDANVAITPLSPSGLIPPQRIMTRDQDGVVFELTGHDIQNSQASVIRQSPVSPTKKPNRQNNGSK